MPGPSALLSIDPVSLTDLAETMEPGSPSRMERLASGELASAFCGLTTTSSSQQGQGQAPASLPGLPKRKPRAPQLGGLQQHSQGSTVPQENALMLPWAKRR